MGRMDYEAGASVEPAGHGREAPLALLWAAQYSHELVFDLQQQRLWLEADADQSQPMAAALQDLISALPQGDPAVSEPPEAHRLPLQDWHWHTDPARFALQVQQIRDWIAAGDLFQANLTACCQTTLPPGAPAGPQAALALYGRLRRHCPAPFAGLAIGTDAAAGEAVLFSPPERFLPRTVHGLVRTRPNKGTRPPRRPPPA